MRELSETIRRRGGLATCAALIFGTVFLHSTRAAELAPMQAAAVRLREPFALAFDREGTWLYVANQRSGSLSVVDARAGRVEAELVVGRGLSALAAFPNGHYLLAADQAGRALMVLEMRGASVRLVDRCPLPGAPATLAVAGDGARCVAASPWSRQLFFVALAMSREASEPTLRITGTVDLPFSPRDMILAGGGTRLIVADAFGGKIAVVNTERCAVESVRTLPAHNIRGLAVTPDGRTLVVAHQSLRRSAKTNFEDVHWGTLMGSHLRSLPMDELLCGSSDATLIERGCVINLGATREGAADPSGLLCDPNGGVIVALGGVDEIGFGRSPSGHIRRAGVGRRPTGLTLARDGKTVYVVDSFDDTVSVVEIASGRRVRTIALGPRPEPTLVERGERLFFDARLSHDGWMSCHSCHTDGHSSGQLADTLGDGSYGAPKRIPSLLGTGSTGPWSWTGSIAHLEDQVRKSLETTMQARTQSEETVAAITAYLRSLAPPPAVARPSEGAARARGLQVFRATGCADCHTPPRYTSAGCFDVDLEDEAGQRKFNPPSLLGVGQRAPLLHDGRAQSLEDVFLKFKHPSSTDLTSEEVADLAAFLRSL